MNPGPSWPGRFPPPTEDAEMLIVLPGSTSSPDAAVLGTCPNLSVPSEQKLAFRVFAAGDQIYRWDGATWVFVAPAAVLYADSREHGYFGTHYAGPTWQSRSGSKATGTVMERCTPDASAIPWLLLEVTATAGFGPFRNVEYIQRLHTVGGLAPSTPGTAIGEEVRVPYSTIYTFYKADG